MDDTPSEKSINIWVFPIAEMVLDLLVIATIIFRQLNRPGISVQPKSPDDVVENRADDEYVGGRR